MLKRIRIQGYKSILDEEVTLQRLSVLFGPNASGKSNFLDALQLLSRLVTSKTLKDAFEPPYRGKPLESFSFESDGIAGHRRRESVAFSFEADLELSPVVIDAVNRQIQEMRSKKGISEEQGSYSPSSGPSLVREKNLRYRIELEILPKSGFLRIINEYLTPLRKDGQPNTSRKPFLEKVGERLHLRMEGQAHPTYYDTRLDHSILSLPLYPPHYPHLVAARQEMASWFFFYFEPRERMRASNPVKEVRHIGLMGEDLAAFLNTLQSVDEKQFGAIEKALRMIIPSVTGISLERNLIGEVELQLVEGTTPVPARVLSEGTLRVLGLLALGGAKDPPSLIGFEEPENGIHPRRIKLVAELLKNRAATEDTQLLVTTHSPILPDLIPDQSLYMCRKDSKGTHILPFTGTDLYRQGEIDKALEDTNPPLLISERILRGDFDA